MGRARRRQGGGLIARGLGLSFWATALGFSVCRPRLLSLRRGKSHAFPPRAARDPPELLCQRGIGPAEPGELSPGPPSSPSETEGVDGGTRLVEGEEKSG